MSDLTFKSAQKQAHETAVEKGWWETDRNVGEQIALMHSELSEALEEWRAGHDVAEVYFTPDKPTKPEGFPIELADLIIRVLDTAEAYGIDLAAAVLAKMEYNRSRPYRHGGKKA